MHTEKPIFTAQFHPEAFGGPTDTEVSCMAPTGWGLGFMEAVLVRVSQTLLPALSWNCFLLSKILLESEICVKIIFSCYALYYC